MSAPRASVWRSAWALWSGAAVAGLCVVALAIGFIGLPAAQADFSAQGLWASICRAAGVPGRWGGDSVPAPTRISTRIVLSDVLAQSHVRLADAAAIGRGATLALQCAACHGARGVSGANAPNLAGQYPEVLIKQLSDYREGDRTSAVMQALAGGLSADQVDDLAAHYASLAKPALSEPRPDLLAPALVRVGDPMRNIAPCISCHGPIGKAGAPWLAGMPRDYLVIQLQHFATGERRNDSHAQMRNMARALSAMEIEALAEFYARAEAVASR